MPYTITPAPGTISIAGDAVTGDGTILKSYPKGTLLFALDIGIVGQLASTPTDDLAASLVSPWGGTAVTDAAFEVYAQSEPAVQSERVRQLVELISTGRAFGLPMIWDDSSTADANPGPGRVRGNSGSDPTILYISKTAADAPGTDISILLAALDDVVNALSRSSLSFRPTDGANAFLELKVTGAVTDATGYVKVPVALLAGAVPADKAALAMSAVPSGKDGPIQPVDIAQAFAGRVGDLTAILRAVRSGAAKVVFWGDSITEATSQIDYSDGFPNLVGDYLREQVGGVVWTTENYSIAGVDVTSAASGSYMPTHDTGWQRTPPISELWPNGVTGSTTWRDHIMAAAPDLLVIAFGANTSSDTAAFAAGLNSIIDYAATWAKPPSIVLVSTNPGTEDPGSPASPYAYVQAAADATRGVASQRNLSLADANALYRLHLDGVDVIRPITEVRDGLSDFVSWVTVSGTRPSISGSTLTFGATGWVRRDREDTNVDLSASTALSTGGIADIGYRGDPAGIDNGYLVRIVDGTGLTWYFNSSPIYGLSLSHASSYKIRVRARGAKHRIWVNDVELSLPDGGHHYGRLYAGWSSLAIAGGTGTITDVTARFGLDRNLGIAKYTEADLLGVFDFITNPVSVGGDGIHHPSTLASLIDYFASFRPVLASIEQQAGKPSLSTAMDASTGSSVEVKNIPSAERIRIVIRSVWPSATGKALQMQISSDNGSSYGSAVPISGSAVSGSFSGIVWIDGVGVSGEKVVAPQVSEGGGAPFSNVGLETSKTGVTNAVKITWTSSGTFSNAGGDMKIDVTAAK